VYSKYLLILNLGYIQGAECHLNVDYRREYVLCTGWTKIGIKLGIIWIQLVFCLPGLLDLDLTSLAEYRHRLILLLSHHQTAA